MPRNQRTNLAEVKEMDIGNIYKKLNDARMDAAVGIKHVAVASGQELGYHVAEITRQVAPHVHLHGDEIYHVLSGRGVMYIGQTKFKDEAPVNVKWEKPYDVIPGDVFNIPEGYAHSLKNSGDQPLIVAFMCPHTHL